MEKNKSKLEAETRTYLGTAVSRLKVLAATAGGLRQTLKVKAGQMALRLLLGRAESLHNLTIYGSADLVAPGQDTNFEPSIEYWTKTLQSNKEDE
ncbi:MAG: hypothetical protein ACRDP6_38320 [Actinoallomurus sp.]